MVISGYFFTDAFSFKFVLNENISECNTSLTNLHTYAAKSLDILSHKDYNICILGEVCPVISISASIRVSENSALLLKKVGGRKMNINYENTIYIIDRNFHLVEFDKTVPTAIRESRWAICATVPS